jgi:putative pyruvate formate lyase activating enzyme
MSICTLCPRGCGVDRAAGQVGFCGMPDGVRVARAAPHFWEEPPISGDMGAGAVFFSGCGLGCRFCQNEKISSGGFGAEISVERLRAIFRHLIEDEECHNLNLVTGTQFLPQILEALDPKPPVPVVWNTGGYETIETLRRLDGVVDVYLPDLKFMDENLARTLCRAPDYPAVATAAIAEMYRQTGAAQYDADGLMVRGTMVRHLILPGCIDNSLRAVEWVAETFPAGAVPLSLMSQYVPMPGMEPPFDRRVTADEYAAVQSWAELCGIRSGFYQDFSSATAEYIPEFTLEGVLNDDPQ